MASFSGTFTAGSEKSDEILNRSGESIGFTLTGSWTGIVVLEKSTSREGWKVIRVFRGNFDSRTKNLDQQNCYLRLRCLELTSGSVGWTLQDVEDEFVFEQFLRDGSQAIGVTDSGDLYVKGTLFSGGGGGGDITIQTDAGTSPVGSLFTFTSADLSVAITGDEVTDEIDFVVDPTQGALATALAGYLPLTGGTISGTVNVSNLTASRFLALDASKNIISPTAATATGMLDAFTGDSGSGGVKGLVPAPAAGDAAKFLKADGSWAALTSLTGPGSSTANAQARWNGTGGNTLKDGKWIEDDDGRITINIGNTSTGATYGTYLTATLTGTASGIHAAERLDLTSAGSGAGAFVMGRWVRLLGGYTGGGMCVGDWVLNTCASTGTDLNGGGGSMGYRVSLGGSSTGHKAAYYASVTGAGSRVFGALVDIEVSLSSGVAVGYSTSVNPGSGTLVPACFYGKLTGTVGQVPNTAGVAVFDNAATSFPGLVVQDNGTTMFLVADGGIVTLGAASTTPKHVLNTDTGTAGSDALTLTNGPTGLAGNPAVYIKITVNGTDRYIPAW